MITTLLDLLGALLIILAITILIATYVPIWIAIGSAGVMITLLSWVVGKRKGGGAA